jgi:hypothetical protein
MVCYSLVWFDMIVPLGEWEKTPYSRVPRKSQRDLRQGVQDSGVQVKIEFLQMSQTMPRPIKRTAFISFFIASFFISLLSPMVWGEEQGLKAGADQTTEFHPAAWLVSLYRDHLSAVDSDRCPSEPSCAKYSIDAFRKHGFFVGWMMTVDRLIHEGREEAQISPLTYSEGRWKIFDPVENNDFWWFPREQMQHD